MWLINARKQLLEFFADIRQAPKYAILSHTWGDEEVTYQDFNAGVRDEVRKKKGFAKIDYTCRQAREDGLDYAWIDTCCIDKTSSAEMSEAINSMFNWYTCASWCYAYLEDVAIVPQGGTAYDSFEFRASRWFTRGWTLQELIAPSQLRLYGKNWRYLGLRDGKLLDEIQRITRIDAEVLQTAGDESVRRNALRNTSIAKRMSWAANRHTTRVEDAAYSLMGLFDVNMPLLYGEGAAAFTRLQEEIIKSSCDHSLFAWNLPIDSIVPNHRGGQLLAPGPAQFKESHGVCLRRSAALGRSYEMSNQGLRISLPLVEPELLPDAESEVLSSRAMLEQPYLAVLNCRKETDASTGLALVLYPYDRSTDGVKRFEFKYLPGHGRICEIDAQRVRTARMTDIVIICREAYVQHRQLEPFRAWRIGLRLTSDFGLAPLHVSDQFTYGWMLTEYDEKDKALMVCPGDPGRTHLVGGGLLLQDMAPLPSGTIQMAIVCFAVEYVGHSHSVRWVAAARAYECIYSEPTQIAADVRRHYLSFFASCEKVQGRPASEVATLTDWDSTVAIGDHQLDVAMESHCFLDEEGFMVKVALSGTPAPLEIIRDSAMGKDTIAAQPNTMPLCSETLPTPWVRVGVFKPMRNRPVYIRQPFIRPHKYRKVECQVEERRSRDSGLGHSLASGSPGVSI